MLKDLLVFIFLMCVGAIVASTVYWNKLTPMQQQAMLRDIHAYLDEGQEPKKPVLPQKTNQLPVVAEPQLVEVNDPKKPIKKDFSREFFQQVPCRKPETREIKSEPSQKVYRWVDEQGKVRFSDTKPEEPVSSFSDISANYKESIQYLNLKVIDDKAQILLGNRERITADLTQIYYLLARELKVKNLRQIDLNVRLFSSQDAFQAYRERVAPKAKTSSGFYSPRLNEATVFQRKHNDEETYSVIRHEASHVIMASLYGRTPSWFNEGLAEYFEELYVSGQGKTARFVDYYHKKVAQQMYASTLPSLHEYFGMRPKDFYGDALELNYAIAWSLIFFMLSDAEGRAVFSAIIDHFIKEPCQGINMVALLNKHYNGGFTHFESRWHNWLANPYNTSHYY